MENDLSEQYSLENTKDKENENMAHGRFYLAVSYSKADLWCWLK